jgi:hypothetical protein
LHFFFKYLKIETLKPKNWDNQFDDLTKFISGD